MSPRVACKYCGYVASPYRLEEKPSGFVCKNRVTCHERLVRFRRAVLAAIDATKGKARDESDDGKNA